MEEGNPITSIMGVGRDDFHPLSSTDIESKPNLSSTSGNELGDMPSTSAGITTMSSIQQKKMKPFKLADAIKPIEYDEMQRMSQDSFNRILQSEGSKRSLDNIFTFLDYLYLDVCETAGVGHVRKKTMTSLVCLSERSFRDSKYNESRE
jgi:hypothetical protein